MDSQAKLALSNNTTAGAANSGSGQHEINNAVNGAAPAGVVTQANEWASSKGLILKLKKVPRLVVVEAGKKIKLPDVPMVWIEEKQRSEPNESDPNYIMALRESQFRQGIVSIDVYLTLGTEIAVLPPDMEAPDSTEWSQTLEELGLDIPASGRARYAAWLKYYALDDEAEVTDLSKRIMQGGGIVFEEQVQEATATFRGAAPRDTDTGSNITT